MPSKNKTVLAIDPGYDRCGFAVLSYGVEEKLLESGCIETDKKDSFYSRLLFVLEEIEKIIKRGDIDELAIENLFFNTNQKTASKVAELRGAVLYLAAKNKLDIYEYTPLQIKQAVTSSGRADKKAVYTMVNSLLKIDKNIKLDDEYDAIACALTHSASSKFNTVR